jgi:hypothetical protein
MVTRLTLVAGVFLPLVGAKIMFIIAHQLSLTRAMTANPAWWSFFAGKNRAIFESPWRLIGIGAIFATVVLQNNQPRTYDRERFWPTMLEKWPVSDCHSLPSDGWYLSAPDATRYLVEVCPRLLLVDTNAFDHIPYIPGDVGMLKKILETGYDLDFENPPEETRHMGALSPNIPAIQKSWESRTDAQWIDIGHDLGLTYVAVPSNWSLQLPRVVKAKNADFAIYTLR